MGKFILGFLCAVVLAIVGALVYFGTGMAPVATSASPMPFEKMMANMALSARVDKEAPKSAPIQADEPNLLAGADVYRMNCSVCHAMPNQPQSDIGKGEFPHPPMLFKGKGVTDDPPGETYWKVKNGIRLTGMPGFAGGLTDTQMWQVSLLLANADKLPPSVQQSLGGATQTSPEAPQK